jgi:hypothetical protein
MFYVATVRYAEGGEGSKILGIYSTEEEAMEILRLYKRNADFEILEIQHVTKNLKPSDLLAIKPFRTPDGDNFVKVYGEEFESQGEYFHHKKVISQEVFHEEVNR